MVLKLKISTRKSRKCQHENCKNIVLFNVKKFSQVHYCYKHYRIVKYQNIIEELEMGFFKNDYNHIITKKKTCYSRNYLKKMIEVTKDIIHYRRLLFKQNNMRNHRGHFSYHCLDKIFSYAYFLNILIDFFRNINRFTIMNDGIQFPIILIESNYLKFDVHFYIRTGVESLNNVDLSIINTFSSLHDFHSDLNIIPHQKDILKIKKNLEKYFWKIFQENNVNEFNFISMDSINIIKNYYDNNLIYDDIFNKVYLRKKRLNNDFLRNTIILTNRLNTKTYFFHK
jgi:hypothetical protein